METILIDTGDGGVCPGTVPDGLDHIDPIKRALKSIDRYYISHLVVSHWHCDHFGGLLPLLSDQGQPQIHSIYHRGLLLRNGLSLQEIDNIDSAQPYRESKMNAEIIAAHPDLKSVFAGDAIRLQTGRGWTARLEVLASGGQTIADDKPSYECKDAGTLENSNSVAVLFSFKFDSTEEFTYFDPGDLTCPVSRRAGRLFRETQDHCV